MNTETERQTFNEVADNYDEIVENAMSIKSSHCYYEEYKVMNLKPYIKKMRKNNNTIKILDYGCGVGFLDMAINNNIENVVIHGFDISDESIKKATASFSGKDYLFTSDLDTLSEGYDIAILSVVLHHVLPDDRTEVMNNIYNRLKNGGMLFIIEHNMKNPFTSKTVNSCEFDKDAVMLSKKIAENLMKQAGFSNISSRYITFFPEKLKFLWCIEKYLGWFPLGAQCMTMGCK